ncbi:MAG: FAD-dependent oxidoreductase, partial [Desulfovibrionaceae bacterium]|nr:FAD-dependent oxidoreductase [Desulfovibrionaceae bacterium]
MGEAPKESTEKKGLAPRIPMPCQPPEERVLNFREVALGYSPEQARQEAGRCLQCKKPLCRGGCPVDVDIPGFIRAIAEGDPDQAYEILASTNSLPAVCGRVCPQEIQCEGKCILTAKGQPIAIGAMERFAADRRLASGAPRSEVLSKEAASGPRVACIGSGPASLTVAGYLVSRGAEVTVFEALHALGGVLSYGIPEFRLPKTGVVEAEISSLARLGVSFITNAVGGKSFTIQELLDQGFGAVFIGVGAGLPQFLNIPGENLIGVFSANEYLTRVNLGRAYDFPKHDTPSYPGRKVTVYGGGNVAMDAARTAVRMGAESVHIVYRRTMKELPARLEEVHHAPG